MPSGGDSNAFKTLSRIDMVEHTGWAYYHVPVEIPPLATTSMGAQGGAIDYVIDTYTTYKHPRFWLWSGHSGSSNVFQNGNATYKITFTGRGTDPIVGFIYLYSKDNQTLFGFNMGFNRQATSDIVAIFNHKYVNFDSYCSRLNMLPTVSFSDTIPQVASVCFVDIITPKYNLNISHPVIVATYTISRAVSDSPEYNFQADYCPGFAIKEGYNNDPNMFVISVGGTGVGDNGALGFLDASGEIIFCVSGYTNNSGSYFGFRKDLFDFSLICPDLYNKYPLPSQ